jgi:hypothetical protein
MKERADRGCRAVAPVWDGRLGASETYAHGHPDNDGQYRALESERALGLSRQYCDAGADAGRGSCRRGHAKAGRDAEGGREQVLDAERACRSTSFDVGGEAMTQRTNGMLWRVWELFLSPRFRLLCALLDTPPPDAADDPHSCSPDP